MNMQSIIQDLINGRDEQARSSIHEYFIAKVKTIREASLSDKSAQELVGARIKINAPHEYADATGKIVGLSSSSDYFKVKLDDGTLLGKVAYDEMTVNPEFTPADVADNKNAERDDPKSTFVGNDRHGN